MQLRFAKLDWNSLCINTRVSFPQPLLEMPSNSLSNPCSLGSNETWSIHHGCSMITKASKLEHTWGFSHCFQTAEQELSKHHIPPSRPIPCLIHSTSSSVTKLHRALAKARRMAPACADLPPPDTVQVTSCLPSRSRKWKGNISCSLKDITRKLWLTLLKDMRSLELWTSFKIKTILFRHAMLYLSHFLSSVKTIH